MDGFAKVIDTIHPIPTSMHRPLISFNVSKVINDGPPQKMGHKHPAISQ